ncbi:PREDICTED: Hermansky-Pudlak syndrome 5 protein [Nanorana parkeri]|uniref:Hermansky-Pudlak syndrome 5 protein n=1 Tax=Nanorana parkeri TaxID=125878 RepID=UPI00085442A5|nr:PREDICTED: Hermansky-Pudlak syndrome 5 protein [Nanorana parkeri]
MAAVVSESPSHVLAEFDSLDPLLSALRLDSSRLKCTCLAASRRWLALGSSGGGLNLIQRDGWKHRLILTHKEGAISRVSCCPHDDDYVAVATSQGIVVVWELNQERRGKPERIYVSSEHKGRKVTALCWDTAVLRAFVGDHMGKVSAIKLNSSKQGKAAAAFVMFPVQIITSVDSRVVQLDYLDGRLLISSLTRSYLCDTEREKFWKIGNKERDGEYGACFFLAGRSSGGQQPLIYCARPGSRMWEVNFEGEVQSTHQFKQLLSSPPLPIISTRMDLQYDPTPGPPQSLAFGKLLFFGDHSVVTWTDRGIYVFLPQNVQVLLWSQVKGIQDMCVYKNELFCLHVDGKIAHLSLISVDRCVERLIKRSSWGLAARVCHLFQNAVISGKARKVLPAEKLEHVKSQLDLVLQADLVKQMEEVLSRMEPMDSACSSRRSSISSHESFNVLDCGIYRVISRRNSQSDEDSGSLHSQTLSEDERLRELSVPLEDEHPEPDTVSHTSVTMDSDRTEHTLPFNLSLPFRSTSPRMSLQAVKESVSSFVRKTTVKIGTLHMSPEIRRKQGAKEEEHPSEEPVDGLAQHEEEKTEIEPPQPSTPSVEEILLGELKFATSEAMHKLQDPQVLFNTEEVGKVLKDWLVNLEKALSPEDPTSSSEASLNSSGESENALTESSDMEEAERKTSVCSRVEEEFVFRVRVPCFMEERLHRDLSQLAMMCVEFNVFASQACSDGNPSACRFIRKYLFLLDLKRLKRCVALNYDETPQVWDTYIEGLRDLAGPGPAALAIERGDLVSAVQKLKDMEPWDNPLLLAYVSRIYEKFGESAARSLYKFYPSVLPVDVKHLCRTNPGHFLAYLDNLIKTKPEEQRLSLLQSLAQPESLKLDWLQLAVSHDAPHPSSSFDSTGNPKPRSHLFTWGYGHLMSLLIKLPSDFVTKESMLTICRTAGYWQGHIALCLQLDRRLEALTTIVYLDDMSLIDEKNGLLPETMDEWKCILHLAQTCGAHQHGVTNGDALVNGHSDWTNCITVENVALLLAKVIGPDRALPYLEDWGLMENMSERYYEICEVMKVAEKRQRALIQSMLERCERFLWSQQA